MKWFRLYSSVLHDPKVQRLSPALFKHWVNLLCLANDSEPRGMLPAVEDIAFALRIKPSEAATMLTQLRRAGLIDSTRDGRDFPHNWPQRQRKSDDIAARVDEHRKREAAKQAGSSGDTAEDVTLHETLLKRPVDTDTDTDTDTETTSLESGSPSCVADADAYSDEQSAHRHEDDEPSKVTTAAPRKRRNSEPLPADSEAMRLATLLRDRIRAHTPDARVPDNATKLQPWAHVVDLMLRQDHRAPPDVEAVIAFATTDEFWRANILSPGNLRDKYDKLNIKRQARTTREEAGNNGGYAGNGRRAGANGVGSAQPVKRFSPEYYAQAAARKRG